MPQQKVFDLSTFGIIDYQAGNLRNVEKAFRAIDQSTITVTSADMVKSVDALILPGVGSFRAGMNGLAAHGLIDTVRRAVLEETIPFLGICLGMQLMMDEGNEGGQTEGLGLVPGCVKLLSADRTRYRLPHIGWDNITAEQSSSMFKGIPVESDFYFVHSYHVTVQDSEMINSKCRYGVEFVSSIESGHIWATQFHPEKSQRYGLMLLQNFANYVQSAS